MNFGGRPCSTQHDFVDTQMITAGFQRFQHCEASTQTVGVTDKPDRPRIGARSAATGMGRWEEPSPGVIGAGPQVVARARNPSPREDHGEGTHPGAPRPPLASPNIRSSEASGLG